MRVAGCNGQLARLLAWAASSRSTEHQFFGTAAAAAAAPDAMGAEGPPLQKNGELAPAVGAAVALSITVAAKVRRVAAMVNGASVCKCGMSIRIHAYLDTHVSMFICACVCVFPPADTWCVGVV